MNNALQQARLNYENGYYETKLEEGLEFQDLVMQELYRVGLILIPYTSRKLQIEKGENMIGAEIKRDGHLRETGNLYIETAEKAHPDNAEYSLSGIYRDDNSWLYIIGDERTIFIFAIKYLRALQKRYKPVETPTSRGFLMPLADAENYCLRSINPAGSPGTVPASPREPPAKSHQAFETIAGSWPEIPKEAFDAYCKGRGISDERKLTALQHQGGYRLMALLELEESDRSGQ